MWSRKDYKRFIQGHLIGWVQLHHLHVWLMFMDVYGQILFNVDQMLCMKKAAWKHVPVEIVAPKRQGHPNFGCLVGASPKIPQQIWFGFEVKLPKCLEFFGCSQSLFLKNLLEIHHPLAHMAWFRFRCPLWASSLRTKGLRDAEVAACSASSSLCSCLAAWQNMCLSFNTASVETWMTSNQTYYSQLWSHKSIMWMFGRKRCLESSLWGLPCES